MIINVVNIVIIVTILFISDCLAEDGMDVFDKPREEAISLRKEIREDQWRAVENIQMDTSGWIPDYSFALPNQPQPKRRRLRKRKRRPQIISLTSDNETAENRYPVRRIKRPQHLHEGQELWPQMEADANIRPNNRRRITPIYHDSIPEKKLEIRENDNISVYQADEPVLEAKTTTEDAIPDLRTILKQAGGVSLSEILQQKNLSLSDLLKGEKEAILAITEKPDNQVITEYKNPVEEDLPKKHNNRFTTKRPSLNLIRKEHVLDTSDATRRVSIKPNNVIVVDFKPSLIGLDIIANQEVSPETTTVIISTTTEVTSENKSKPKLPITNAKLNKVLKSTIKTAVENEVFPTTIPPKAYKIDINELFGLTSIDQTQNNQEGPLRMSLDLNQVVEKRLESSTRLPYEITTLETMPDKLKTITAKDEILEVLKDEEAKTYLKKLLKVRNMTFDDLVELRERGSSQKHLADLFHNSTKEPEPKDEPLQGSVKKSTIKKYLEESKEDNDTSTNKNQMDRKPKSRTSSPLELTDSDGDRYVASVESDELKSIEETKDKDKYTVTSFPTFKIESEKKLKEKAPLQPEIDLWKNNYPDLFSDFYRRTHQKGIVEDLSEKYLEELRNVVDEVENTISENRNEKLNVETVRETYDDAGEDNVFIKLPYGVKHAIIASLLIIGISLVIFLTILMIFKWSQKHKNKLCYKGSFPCSKFRSPILDGDIERRSFRTFMSETLGRKKHYYKQHLQSVSDAVWENDRKPFQ